MSQLYGECIGSFQTLELLRLIPTLLAPRFL